MALFKKSPESQPEQSQEPVGAGPQPTPGLPVNDILLLRQQGLSNNQIIQTLQRSGYSPSQIYDALNQADLQSAAPINQDDETLVQPQAQATPQQIAEQPFGEPEPQPVTEETQEAYDTRIEELAEAIIDEKWNELLKNINKIVEWKDRTDSRIERVENQVKMQQKSQENIKAELNSKISQYDTAITDVVAQMKAVEAVFKKILPTLVTTVNELSRLTKKLSKR